MEHFKEILQNIISTIVISPSDSDTNRAQKIIWYAFFGSIIILFVLSWVIFVMLTFTNDNVKVPYIENEMLYSALNKLSDRGLVANAAPKYNDEYEEGVVYKQRPNQGSIVKQGRTVTFSVSLGPRKSALPDFRGFTRFELIEYLNEVYPASEDIPYTVDRSIYEFNDNVEKGRIIKQDPPDGTPIQNVKKVTFWISNGPADYSAPALQNYTDRPIEEVSVELADLEIYYGYDFIPTRDRKKDMLVAEQSIGEGALIYDIMAENRMLILKIFQYQYIKGEKVIGTYLLDVPRKPLPFLLEVKVKSNKPNEKIILKRTLKGGVSLPVPYTARTGANLRVYIDGTLYSEIILENELLETSQ